MSLSLIAFSRSIEVYTLYVVSILVISHYYNLYYYNIHVFLCVCVVSQHSSFDYLSIICAIVIAINNKTK